MGVDDHIAIWTTEKTDRPVSASHRRVRGVAFLLAAAARVTRQLRLIPLPT